MEIDAINSIRISSGKNQCSKQIFKFGTKNRSCLVGFVRFVVFVFYNLLMLFFCFQCLLVLVCFCRFFLLVVFWLVVVVVLFCLF